MMNPARKKKLTVVAAVLTLVILVSGLILYALRQNINLFYTPTQLTAGEGQGKRLVRVGGMVVKGSIKRQTDDLLAVEFKLTDYQQTVTVTYRGILPDLFRDEQGIVALGNVVDNTHFKASEVLAKHDANYMPPDVKDALSKTTRKGDERAT